MQYQDVLNWSALATPIYFKEIEDNSMTCKIQTWALLEILCPFIPDTFAHCNSYNCLYGDSSSTTSKHVNI